MQNLKIMNSLFVRTIYHLSLLLLIEIEFEHIIDIDR